MTRIVAVQPDMFGGPDVEGEAWEPEFFAWHWCGLFFPPNADQVRQMKMQRADTLTPEEAAGFDRMAAVREKADADPLARTFNRAILNHEAELKERAR